MRALFDIFSKDPSKKWERKGETRLTFNLAAESLNGVAIGDSFEKLSVFGRPDNKKPFEVQMFDFRDLGLEIGGADGRVRYFSFSVQNYQGRAKPCEVTLISERGTPILLAGHTKFGEVESVLGKPLEVKRDDGEVSCRYKYRRLILVFEFDENELFLFEAGLEDEV